MTEQKTLTTIADVFLTIKLSPSPVADVFFCRPLDDQDETHYWPSQTMAARGRSLYAVELDSAAVANVKVEKPGPPPLVIFVTNAKTGKTEWIESSVKVPVSRLKR